MCHGFAPDFLSTDEIQRLFKKPCSVPFTDTYYTSYISSEITLDFDSKCKARWYLLTWPMRTKGGDATGQSETWFAPGEHLEIGECRAGFVFSSELFSENYFRMYKEWTECVPVTSPRHKRHRHSCKRESTMITRLPLIKYGHNHRSGHRHIL